MQAFDEDPGISCFPRAGRRARISLQVLAFSLQTGALGPQEAVRRRAAKEGGNVLERKLHTLLFLPHQRLLSLNAPVCRHLLS